MRNHTTLLTFILAMALSTGCDRKPSGDQKKSPGLGTVEQGGGQYQESNYTPATNTNRARRPPTPPPQLGPERAGAHILIAYQGSAARKPGITRTKEQALALAKQLAAETKKNPASFAALAKKHSDGPTGPRGGILGAWPKGRMVPEFDTAIDGLKVGEVSAPVETRFGFHVIKRLETKYAGRHILVAYKGAMRAKDTITRTKEQALALAKKIGAEAKKTPAGFPDLAKKYSDGPSGPKGGSLGAWQPGRMVLEFQAAVESMPIGAISDPVETAFGFHIIKREDPKTLAR